MRKAIFAAMAALLVLSCSKKAVQDEYGYIIKDNQIVYNTPARPADQQSMLNFACDPIENVRVGFVGLGMRGPGAVQRFCYLEDATIVALCDLYPERVEDAQKILDRHGKARAAEYSGEEGYKELCQRDDIDLVYLAVPWQLHTPIAVYAMEHGKHVAIEVPAATSIEECWALVNTSERTRKHCMMLENCCYDFFELSTLAMVQAGAIGEPIHAEGSYQHNLDPFWKAYWDNWRLKENQKNRGDLYPTHGLGPVCQVLNIHRGDRMKTLVAMDTKPFNGAKMSEKLYGKADATFAAGDQTTTLIQTEKGKTILVEHDVMTPRPYSRMYQIVGTDGYAAKYPVSMLCFREFEEGQPVDAHTVGTEKVYRGAAADEMLEKYPSPILTPELVALAKEVGGHGGMDYIMDYRMVYCLRNGLPMDIDVYDLAEWCCVTPLSRLSLENGNMPVEVPDFTRGAWDKLPGFSYAFAE